MTDGEIFVPMGGEVTVNGVTYSGHYYSAEPSLTPEQEFQLTVAHLSTGNHPCVFCLRLGCEWLIFASPSGPSLTADPVSPCCEDCHADLVAGDEQAIRDRVLADGGSPALLESIDELLPRITGTRHR